MRRREFIKALGATAAWPLAAHAQTQPPKAQPKLTKEQQEALDAYTKAVDDFKAVIAERRAQIDARQPLPDKPGQALYLARVAVMSTYKDLTDALPSRIGRPNRFGVPPPTAFHQRPLALEMATTLSSATTQTFRLPESAAWRARA